MAGLPANPRCGSSGLSAIEPSNIWFPHNTPKHSGATAKAALRALGGNRRPSGAEAGCVREGISGSETPTTCNSGRPRREAYPRCCWVSTAITAKAALRVADGVGIWYKCCQLKGALGRNGSRAPEGPGGAWGCSERRFPCEDRRFVFGLRHLHLSTLCHGRPASRASASERAKVTKVATSPKRWRDDPLRRVAPPLRAAAPDPSGPTWRGTTRCDILPVLFGGRRSQPRHAGPSSTERRAGQAMTRLRLERGP